MFQSPSWIRGGHAQTILGYFLGGSRVLTGEARVKIPVSHGDQLAARFYRGDSGTTVLLFHGLAGSASSPYMSRIAKQCLEKGHSVLVVNHRGCGEGRRLSHRKPYHSGSGEDLAAAIRYAREMCNGKERLIAIGFSLSANALLLQLGRLGASSSESLPDAAIAVNPPIQLAVAAKSLTRGLNRLYDFTFLSKCRADIKRRQSQGWLPLEKNYAQARSIYELDELYTAEEAGYRSREDYYKNCSAASVIDRIAIPTFILTAKDDPFVCYRDFENLTVPSNVRLLVTPTGGHMGYLAKKSGSLMPAFWMDEMIGRWVDEIVGA